MRKIFSIILLSASCGQNVFNSLESKDPAEEACAYLNRQEPSKAIALMLSAVGPVYKAAYDGIDQSMSVLDIADEFNAAYINSSNRDNIAKYVSILASAHAQKFGIDPLSLALGFATGASGSSGSSGASGTMLYELLDDASTGISGASGSSNTTDLAKLYPALPAATDYYIFGLNVATQILASIDKDSFTTSDYLKQSLFLIAGAAMLIKKIDKNGDGTIGIDELVDLTDEDAVNFYSVIATAAQASGQADASKTASKATAQLESIQAKIDASAGSTAADKVKEYLSKGENSDTSGASGISGASGTSGETGSTTGSSGP